MKDKGTLKIIKHDLKQSAEDWIYETDLNVELCDGSTSEGTR